MLTPTVEIEGYKGGYQNIDPSDDTPPDANRAWFEVWSMEQPFLTNDPVKNPSEEIIRKNVIVFRHECDLGRTTFTRPIKDKVEFDKDTGKWIVRKLAQGKNSYIQRYPNQWNAFARGTEYVEPGTPLENLFRTDPTRAEMYKRQYRIDTVEQLSRLTESDTDNIGMGAKDDRNKARAYLERTKEAVNGMQSKAKIDKLEAICESQSKQIEDLTSKLTQLLKAQIEAAEAEPEQVSRPRGRPRKEAEA